MPALCALCSTRVRGGEHTRIAFTRNPAGEVIGAVLNPGPWQIVGEKLNERGEGTNAGADLLAAVGIDPAAAPRMAAPIGPRRRGSAS